ncbi:hypothetical protein BT96DRAFT_945037 [Gymnopus androsaceus JB14]|uniref:Uncharacterized protein n=1 Tax=Gymnopus androsaceus JB14 TaxID=1447944 RepID=A0A6A4H3G3_9AGAR|nr:hypothetical protein BT96DRAFT_945037 [Gymnopus androsaceus JB14]
MTGLPWTPSQKTTTEGRAVAISKLLKMKLRVPPVLVNKNMLNKSSSLKRWESMRLELEKAQAKAQYALQDAEEDVDEAYGKASALIINFLQQQPKVKPNSNTGRLLAMFRSFH